MRFFDAIVRSNLVITRPSKNNSEMFFLREIAENHWKSYEINKDLNGRNKNM
jgi:hypothetical protein